MATRSGIIYSILFVIAFALASGCGSKTRQSPPKQQVEGTVRAILPAFLSLDDIELEPVSTGSDTAKVNFKAIVIPKEDLCQVDREVEGTPKVTLLRVVQPAGTKLSLYGSVEGRRIVDQWTLEAPQIQVGSKQFGEPRGAFGGQAYLSGSNEADAALKQQAANAEAQRVAIKAAQEQLEREQKASEERKASELKARQAKEEEERIALEKRRQAEIERRNKEAERQRKLADRRDAEDAKKAEVETARAHWQDLLRQANDKLYVANDDPEGAARERDRVVAAKKGAEEAKKAYEAVEKEYEAMKREHEATK